LYEKRLRDFLDKKEDLESAFGSFEEKQQMDLPKLIEDTRPLLEDLAKIWEDSEIKEKRLLIKVLFANNLSY